MTAENNPNFNPEKYTAIASNHLVAYAIYSLQNDGDEISAEDIISACFMLFPRKFSLRTYPQWPDSALIGRRLHDCERKGWLTARIDTGFKLTALGTRLAEKVAKGLGVAIPKKEKPKKVHKLQVGKLQVTEAVKPVDKVQVTKTAEPAPATTKPAKKARKKRVDKLQVTETVKLAAQAKTTVHRPPSTGKVEKQVAEVKVTEVVKPAPVAKPAPVKPKVEKAKEKQVTEAKPVSKLRVDKLQVAEEKPAPVKPAPAVKPEPVAKPKAKVIPSSTVPTVSAEEKAKAGKFVKMMETSDAYRLYKKSGANANVGEFDFRSLLLCTMESSHETLARNVDLFKGYAEIHNRQDLVAFLGFCAEKFAHLLTPEKKAVKKFK
jgi:hypothetical protein